MSKILYYGWYDHGNLGDDQYKISFPTLFPHHENRFVKQLLPTDVDWADEVVVGGGNIVNRHFLDQIAKSIPLNKPVSLFSVGATDVPTENPNQLKRFKRIWVRDLGSQKKLENLGIKADYAPDSSWILKANHDHGNELWKSLYQKQGKDLYSKRVIVALNAHLTSKQPDFLARDAYRWQVFVDDLSNIIDNTSASFTFMPFGRKMPWDDRCPGSWVAHKCKWHGKNAVIWDEWNVQDSLDFIATADAVISMRFHSTLFACINGIPILDITHHDKNQSFLNENGLGDYGISYWDFPREKAKRLLDDLLSKDHRTVFQNVAKTQTERLTTYTKDLI